MSIALFQQQYYYMSIVFYIYLFKTLFLRFKEIIKKNLQNL